MPFSQPDPFTGHPGLVVDMGIQPRTHSIQDELENSRLSHNSGEQLDSPFAASLNNVPGYDES